MSRFLFCLFFYGWQHYQWIQNGYRIEAEQKKQLQLAEMQRQLKLERASLRAPARVDAIARRDLGMVLPAPGQLVTFSADAPLAINALLFVPKENTEKLGFARTEAAVSLYCRKVLIDAKPKDLLPEWLRFAQGWYLFVFGAAVVLLGPVSSVRTAPPARMKASRSRSAKTRPSSMVRM